MKGFLLDENLPSRLKCLPGLPAVPFSKAGEHPSDTDIWNFALQHELVIVSKDADFSDRIIMQSPPERNGCMARAVYRGE
jgi:predicted nuclease of predicted toxin-antitoxin system